jgi:membrane fusion protein, copper/silver efflux system
MNKQKLLLSLCILGGISLGIFGFFIGISLSANTSHMTDATTLSPIKKETIWTCSMHPQIKLNQPGKCPICGMDLIPLKFDSQVGLREIRLSKQAENLANIEVVPAIRKEFYLPVQMVGKISLDETRSKKITARYAGRLDRLFVDYTGIEVKKGEHLFETYSPTLITAQEELLQAIESAQAMQKSSIESIRISSEKAVDASRDKLRLWGLTSEQIKQFEKNKTITENVTTFSPVEGIVLKKHAEEGSYVKEGSFIYNIASLEHLWVELDAYESDLQWLHYAQEVSFTTEAWPGEEFRGRISFIHPTLNNKTRTVKVRVNINNKDRRLKPDMFVRANVRVHVNAAGKAIKTALAGMWISPMHPEIISDKPGPCTVCGMDLVKAENYGFTSKSVEDENPLLIPASAPLITGKRAVIYLKSRSQEGIYEGRTITLGLKAGDYYIVKSGLKQGDLVVTRGAFKIDSALQIQAKPSMMSNGVDNTVEVIDVNLSFKKSLSSMYNIYNDISQELSKDSIKGLALKGDELIKALKSVDESRESSKAAIYWRKKSRKVELAINLLKNSASLSQARTNFEKVSNVIIDLIKTFGTVEKINLAFCPMAFNDQGAYWLQKSADVENPYFGSQMYHCGEFKQQFSLQVEKVNFTIQTATILEETLSIYLKVSSMLADDKAPPIKVYKDLLTKLKSINMKSMPEEVHLTFVKELKTITAAINSLNDNVKLVKHRESFEKISSGLLSFMKMGSFLKKDSYVFNCPMALDGKGANWLQLSKKTVNPYMGHSMLTCGEVKASFKARKSTMGKRLVPEKSTPKMKHELHKAKDMKPELHPTKEIKKLPENSQKTIIDLNKKAAHNHLQNTSKLNLAVIKIYSNIHNALSQDRLPEDQKEQLLKALFSVKPNKEITSIVKNIYSAKNISEVRKYFRLLSNFLTKLAESGSIPKDINLAYCSMAFGGKGAYWLQTGDEIENPYFGSKMYRCGDIKKKISGGK